MDWLLNVKFVYRIVWANGKYQCNPHKYKQASTYGISQVISMFCILAAGVLLYSCLRPRMYTESEKKVAISYSTLKRAQAPCECEIANTKFKRAEFFQSISNCSKKKKKRLFEIRHSSKWKCQMSRFFLASFQLYYLIYCSTDLFHVHNHNLTKA